MANKNTRLLRKLVRKACKRRADSVEWQTPVADYFNHDGIQLRTVRVPTAIVRGDGVNSVNKRRNSCQRIYVNKGSDGRTASLTAHEPYVRHEPMMFPNHRQYANWEYRKPGGANIASQSSA